MQPDSCALRVFSVTDSDSQRGAICLCSNLYVGPSVTFVRRVVALALFSHRRSRHGCGLALQVGRRPRKRSRAVHAEARSVAAVRPFDLWNRETKTGTRTVDSSVGQLFTTCVDTVNIYDSTQHNSRFRGREKKWRNKSCTICLCFSS